MTFSVSGFSGSLTLGILAFAAALALPPLAWSQQPTASVTPAALAPAVPIAAGDEQTDAFCTYDVSDEVVAFCPKLTAFQEAVNKAKTANPAITADVLQLQLRSTLNYLNPGAFGSEPEVVSAIKNSLIMQQLASQASTQLSQLLTQPVNASTLAAAAQSTGVLRTDQQFSSSSNASGTTSLVAKAGSAELLALAVDTGALTQSVNGSTATLTANADEIFRLITGYQPDCLMNCGKNGAPSRAFERDVLNPLNFTATMALAQASTETTATSGQASGTTNVGVTTAAIPTGAGKLTAFTAKYQILNKFDPRSKEFRAAWQKEIPNFVPVAADLNSAVQALYTQLQTDPTFKAAQSDAAYQSTLLKDALADPSGKALVADWQKLWTTDTATALKSANVPALVNTIVAKQQVFANAWRAAFADVAGNMFTVQYTFSKPLAQPQTHDVTGVYAHSWAGYGSVTVNGAISIYNGALPAGAQYGRIHYGQLSGEYDRTLTKSSTAYQTDLSVAGYWQYQPEPSVLNIPAGTIAPGTTIPLPNGTQEFVGTAGSLWVTQGKLTISGPGGINIPIGVSWSNKTDLLQGSKVGGQVGISYNFSSLAGLF